jgi:hypothetical protein
MTTTEPPGMTPEEIRDLLNADQEVWLWEGGYAKHKVLGVEDLTADHVALGAHFTVMFRGSITGKILGKHMNREATVKAVTRPKPEEPAGEHGS